ncbi:MAG: TAT-variant-translocated molybdopterin oxidoreductase [Terrimicrobiaceae bacterium]
MKKIPNHPPLEDKPTLWRSFAELERSPGFEETLWREFSRGAQTFGDSGLNKRDFMKLMGASVALAGVGLAGCRRPEAHLVPFTKGVEWSIPGKFLYYATSMPTRGGAIPLVVTTSDGRPTKLEGNPLHPASNGATDAFSQASVLDLYDPHRSKEIKLDGATTDRAALDAFLAELAKTKPQGVAILAERTNSPTRESLRTSLEAAYPGLLWCEYEPLDPGQRQQAMVACYGEGVRLIPKFERADVLLALDIDFLNPSENGPAYAAGFFTRRNPDQKGAPMNRLYVVENHYTTTGGLADHRLRCRASDIGEAARRLASHIASKISSPVLASLLGACPVTDSDLNDEWLNVCADDLVANAGRCLVGVGKLQPAWVQALVFGINEALGNHGATLMAASSGSRAPRSIGDLASAIAAGNVQTLFILGGNPAYNAPADLDFTNLLSKVPTVVRWGLFEDETSRAAKWHVPAAHYLESWGDTRTFDGTYSAIQPMVLPLWDGIQELDLLNALLGNPATSGPALVQSTFALLSGVAFPRSASEAGGATAADAPLQWSEFLRIGYLAGSAFALVPPPFNTAGAAALIKSTASQVSKGIELVFLQSSSVDDGRYANNSWLQETPDFETKVTWDNVLLISPSTAKKLGIRANNYSPLYDVPLAFNKLTKDENLRTDTDFDIVADIVEISAGGKSIRAAALVAPGHADDSVSIALGYGRSGVSALLEGVGFDAYPLRDTSSPRFRQDVTIQPTGETYALARTQEAKSMHGRDLVREGTLARYTEDPKFPQTMGMDGHIPPNISLYTHPELTSKEQWGMTVDLNTCIGCSACLLACQAENNVPVVGKEQVRKNRDMAWIRIDRYFAGDPEDPEMLAQAIMCQHCENAPCETVCPVNATVHSEDGLNLMAYNRCIGTRYCANNCPWKVRRFNYFDYNQRPLDKLYWGPLAKKGMADSLKMSKNPNVTVRMRGVMEKCTFCIQRIEEAKIQRLVEAGPRNKNEVPVREFKVACQQACPSDSIVFGNINDPKARVTRLRAADRGYTMFKYINAAPRVTYLARIRNPNPLMPGAEKVGMANGLPHGHHGDDHGAPHNPTHSPADSHTPHGDHSQPDAAHESAAPAHH